MGGAHCRKPTNCLLVRPGESHTRAPLSPPCGPKMGLLWDLSKGDEFVENGKRHHRGLERGMQEFTWKRRGQDGKEMAI